MINQVNSNNYGEKTSSGVVLVDFWADWCGPCKRMHPILEKVDERLGSRGLSIVKVDVSEDENIVLASGLGVSNIPALIIYKDGGIVSRLVGFQSEQALVSAIEPLLPTV